MTLEPAAEDLIRALAPQVLGTLVRRYGQFDECEDALQEALLAAATQWPTDGVPDNPRAWLVTVASRRMTDLVRRDAARRRREHATASALPGDDRAAPPAEAVADATTSDVDDTLVLLCLCCHPALSPTSQIALTLRAIGGLTTSEIARAFMVPEPTMGQRISRAKQLIKEAGNTFDHPAPTELPDRRRAVLHVLYLIFNEGYAASSGPNLQRADLTTEAIRLTREVARSWPEDGEAVGLLALMLLNQARRATRTTASGQLVPLAEQDRTRWDRALIAEGVELITDALARRPLGPYQLQAAIAAVHDEAPDATQTDWPQILALYTLLERLGPNPMVTLNRSVAVAMVHGPHAGLDLLATLDVDERVRGHHRLDAVRAHLLEMAGDTHAAFEAYRRAARRTTSVPEQRHLDARAARLRHSTSSAP